jgi:hypothetical protein
MTLLRVASRTAKARTLQNGVFRAHRSSPHSPYLEYGSLTGFVLHPKLHHFEKILDAKGDELFWDWFIRTDFPAEEISMYGSILRKFAVNNINLSSVLCI